MNWVVRLADDAQATLTDLSPKHKGQVSKSISAMEHDPFRGDVEALQGKEWHGCYRKRAGDFRIVFTVDRSHRFVDVVAILRRSEKTYR